MVLDPVGSHGIQPCTAAKQGGTGTQAMNHTGTGAGLSKGSGGIRGINRGVEIVGSSSCGFKPSVTADCAACSVQGRVLHQLFPVLGPSSQEGPGGAGACPQKGTELGRDWSTRSS